MSPVEGTTPKKVPKKRAVKAGSSLPPKKVAARTAAKRPAPKSGVVSKKVSHSDEAQSRPVAVTARAKASSRREANVIDDVVVVAPTTMSLRAREKALAILSEMSKNAGTISYVAGLALILMGGSYSVISAGYFPAAQRQLAQVLPGTIASTTAETTEVTQTILAPVLSIATAPPAELHGTASVSFSLTDADNVQIHAYNMDTGKLISISYDKSALFSYVFMLDQQKLNSGQYQIKVTARSLSDKSIHNYPIGRFVVPAVPGTTTTTSGTTTTTTTSTTQTTTTSGNTGTTTQTTTTGATTTTPALEVKLSVPSRTIVGNSIIKAKAPLNTKSINFLIRSNGVTQLLGSGTKTADYWYYFFNSVNTPNGTHEVLARANVEGTYVVSDPLKIKVENFVASTPTPAPTPAPVPVPEATDVPVPPPPAPKEENVNPEEKSQVKREFIDPEAEDVIEPKDAPKPQPQPLSEETKAVLRDNKDELGELLKRYAVAQQSGNQMTIQIALKELENAKARIVKETQPEAAAKIDLELTERIERLKNKVETFEKLRRGSDKNDVHTDSDGDGISDFDEQTLYHTDAHNPDTDHDGFLDGTEIMRGYNPTDAKAEATVTYELPQETIGLVHDDVLKVETVAPLLKHDESGAVQEVQAEIRGKALPNSYVTLYVFSSPVVVTVRTDNDGSFVYNFEKELEDGTHDVYVAVTDNTGAIVARSAPFSFVKEAQAFTPVNTAQADAVNSDSLTDLKSFDIYTVVVGLGVVALGFILLMLGLGLRKKEVITPATEVV